MNLKCCSFRFPTKRTKTVRYFFVLSQAIFLAEKKGGNCVTASTTTIFCSAGKRVWHYHSSPSPFFASSSENFSRQLFLPREMWEVNEPLSSFFLKWLPNWRCRRGRKKEKEKRMCNLITTNVLRKTIRQKNRRGGEKRSFIQRMLFSRNSIPSPEPLSIYLPPLMQILPPAFPLLSPLPIKSAPEKKREKYIFLGSGPKKGEGGKLVFLPLFSPKSISWKMKVLCVWEIATIFSAPPFSERDYTTILMGGNGVWCWHA